MNTPQFRARVTFGGLDVDLCCGDKSIAVLRIPDEDLEDLIIRGLERLSGQGKVSENLRSTCNCVGELR
jgi:hypothetical protein